MIFHSTHTPGRGRGKKIGFPTMNLKIPKDLHLEEGIYAAWIVIGSVTYRGALHYGPIPTFSEREKTLEVYLLDVAEEAFPETKNASIEIDVVEKLRDIQNFDSAGELALAIASDVEKIQVILK